MITLRLDIVFFFFLAKSFYKNLYIIYPQYLANCSRRNFLFLNCYQWMHLFEIRPKA